MDGDCCYYVLNKISIHEIKKRAAFKKAAFFIGMTFRWKNLDNYSFK